MRKGKLVAVLLVVLLCLIVSCVSAATEQAQVTSNVSVTEPAEASSVSVTESATTPSDVVATKTTAVAVTVAESTQATGAVSATKPAKPLDIVTFGPNLYNDPSVNDVTPKVTKRLFLTVQPFASGLYMWSARPDTSFTLPLAHKMGLGTVVQCSIGDSPEDDTLERELLIKECLAGNVNLAVAGAECVEKPADVDRVHEVLWQLKGTGTRTASCQGWKDWLKYRDELGADCDEIIASMYPYWEETSIDKALARVKAHYAKLKEAYPTKPVWVMTGWPSGGGVCGDAVASPENAARYLKEINEWRTTNHVRVIYFAAFDEPYKAKDGVKEEAFWGIWDRYEQLKPGMKAALGIR